MDYLIIALLLFLLIGGSIFLANQIGLIGKPISLQKKHLSKEEQLEIKRKEEEMNIDFDKLRQVLSRREFATGMITNSPGETFSATHIHDETPEQLLERAKKHGINLEHYKKHN